MRLMCSHNKSRHLQAINGLLGRRYAAPMRSTLSFTEVQMKYLFFVFFISFASLSYSEEFVWKDSSGRPVPDTEARKSKSGFCGWLLLTPDENWREKWETSPDTTPHFSEKNTVKLGEKLFILPFFTNAEIDRSRNVKILCDIQVVRHNGTYSINERGIECFNGKLLGNQFSLYLASTVIGFSGENSDPLGDWVVNLKFIETTKQVELPLKAKFTL